MSAYLVSKHTIDMLVAACEPDDVESTLTAAGLSHCVDVMYGHGDCSRSVLGAYLWGVNAWSVMTRYPDVTRDNMRAMPGGPEHPDWMWLPGFVAPYAVSYRYVAPDWASLSWEQKRTVMGGKLLGAIHQYEYQSCEFAEYPHTPAHRLMSELALALSLQYSVGE